MGLYDRFQIILFDSSEMHVICILEIFLQPEHDTVLDEFVKKSGQHFRRLPCCV